ncbi:hypothetical protein [Vibrio parahaemolyticus]
MSDDNVALAIYCSFVFLMSSLGLLFFVEVPVNNKDVAVALFQAVGPLFNSLK